MKSHYTVEQADAVETPSDLLLLKHAGFFFGVDRCVAGKLIAGGVCSREALDLQPGEHVVLQTNGVIKPARVMFLGTPPLGDFQYEQMRAYACQAIRVLSHQTLPIRKLTTTVHGTGYGLDPAESLQSLLRGFEEGLAASGKPGPAEIQFVERNERVARILALALDAACLAAGTTNAAPNPDPQAAPTVDQAAKPIPLSPAEPLDKRHVFVAMPFSEEFEDVYEYGIYGPVRNCGLICEKTNESAFTGDILQRIRDRIETAWLVIADLTEGRPNVYLEVGYAWGKGKDVILLARQGEELHFDVARHRCIYYKSIRQLARDLEKLLRGLAGWQDE